MSNATRIPSTLSPDSEDNALRPSDEALEKSAAAQSSEAESETSVHYLVAVQNRHRRVQRVAMIASAVGKPVTNLTSLIRFSASDPTLGKCMLDALNQEDVALEKVERVAMDFGVMPKS